jgi:hypothetical protein
MSPEDTRKLIDTHPGLSFTLTDPDNEDVVIHCTTPEEFAEKVHEDPTSWFWSVYNISSAWQSTVERVEDLESKSKSMKVDFDVKMQECRDTENDRSQLEEENDTLIRELNAAQDKLNKRQSRWHTKEAEYQARVKQDWDTAKSNESWYQQQIKTLWQRLQDQRPDEPFSITRNFRRQEEFPGFGDIDDDQSTHTGYAAAPRQHSRPLFPPPEGTRHFQPEESPFMGSHVSASAGGNSRYKDAPEFSGEPNGKVDYEDWKEHVKAKLRHSSQIYDTPRSQIEYALISTTGIARQVIKVRARHEDPNRYRNLEELFADMDLQFLDFNITRSAQHKLENGSMIMKTGEKFSDWYPRFTASLAPVYSMFPEPHGEVMRKKWFINNLNNRLSNGLKMTGNFEHWSYARCVTYCREVESIDASEKVESTVSRRSNNHLAPLRKEEKIAKGQRKGKHVTPDRPREIWSKLKAESRCLHCGEKGHRFSEKSATCTNSPAKSDKELAKELHITLAYMTLQQMQAEWSDPEEEQYLSATLEKDDSEDDSGKA